MRKKLSKIAAVVSGVLMMGMAFVTMNAPVFADVENNQNQGQAQGQTQVQQNSAQPRDCVETAILDGCNGIGGLVLSIVDFLTAGVGILGVIGITVVGIQYLTAGGNEEKTRKAKRRMLEIVIGILAYVIMYAILKWLLPNLSFS